MVFVGVGWWLEKDEPKKEGGEKKEGVGAKKDVASTLVVPAPSCGDDGAKAVEVSKYDYVQQGYYGRDVQLKC